MKNLFLTFGIVEYFNIGNIIKNNKFPKQKHIEKFIIYVSFMFLRGQHTGNIFNFPVFNKEKLTNKQEIPVSDLLYLSLHQLF